ncbi:hypothetical protein SUGI_0469620 [Cryptomeria japonica]|nr:hypothetical protein SUGI_0469620 [Cryptomeria japonica]
MFDCPSDIQGVRQDHSTKRIGRVSFDRGKCVDAISRPSCTHSSCNVHELELKAFLQNGNTLLPWLLICLPRVRHCKYLVLPRKLLVK